MTEVVSIDVVVCTYNRARDLDRALTALARQRTPPLVAWSVLVVDNRSADDTPGVVDAHMRAGVLPGLRRVVETEQGLTPARHRGLLETTAEWVAFVDDDNLLRPDWIAEAAQAARLSPEAGAIGGRVVPDWAVPPPAYIPPFKWAYAMQDYGPESREVGGLVGAGLLVRRAALEATGWMDGPLLKDRVGTRLVSGGDVEIGLRLQGRGYTLRYHPGCVLDHRVGPERMERPFLFRLVNGLGTSHALSAALTWSGPIHAWRQWVRAEARRHAGRSAREFADALRRRPGHGVTPALAWASFSMGVTRALKEVKQMPQSERDELFGAAKRSPSTSVPTS